MSKCGRETDVVTGAFGFTGQHITRRLLALGKGARTLTGHPNRPNPFGDRISVAPFNFDHPRELTNSLRGATTLYNTYWIRFPYGQLTFGRAVENTRTLIKAAEEAGLRRIVHISITNAAEDSPFPYFRGKAMVEKAIVQSRLSHAIIRPSVIFGTEGILINNIAWLLRRLPVFAVPGSGDYRLQPVFVEDLAEIAVDAGLRGDNIAVDAVGPETAPFNALVRLIADTVHSRAKIIHLSPVLVLLLVRALGNLVNDVVLTRDEIEGLMANLLVSSGPPTGHTRLSTWLAQNADQVGTRYLSELRRHYR